MKAKYGIFCTKTEKEYILASVFGHKKWIKEDSYGTGKEGDKDKDGSKPS